MAALDESVDPAARRRTMFPTNRPPENYRSVTGVAFISDDRAPPTGVKCVRSADPNTAQKGGGQGRPSTLHEIKAPKADRNHPDSSKMAFNSKDANSKPKIQNKGIRDKGQGDAGTATQ